MRLSTIWTLFRRVPAWGWVGAVSLGLTAALALDLSPWLRGDLDWRWEYVPIYSWGRVSGVALCLALYIAGAALAWRWGQVSERRAWGVVSAAVALAVALQWIGLTINNPDPLSTLMYRTTSPYMSGFHEIGIRVEDAGAYLREFPELVPSYLPHPQRRPPGLILYFAALKRVLSRAPALVDQLAHTLHRYRCEYWPMLYLSDVDFVTAAGSLLTLALNAAALWPFFAAAQPLIGRRPALAAVLVSPLIPGYVLWAGIWDQALTIITCLLLWLLYQALVLRRSWAWVAAGLLISFGSFITYATLPLAGFVAFCAGLEVWRELAFWRAHIPRLILGGIGFAAGLASLWGVYWLFFGVSFFEVYRATTESHFAMPTRYGSRLWYSPYDFGLYLGFGLALLALTAALRITHAWVQRRPRAPASSFAIAGALLIVTLAVLNLSRAEVGRVWVPYMPLMVFLAFAAAGGPAHSVGRWVLTASVISVQLLMMLSVFVGRGYELPSSDQVPSEATALSVTLDEVIELAGYQLSARQLKAGESLSITLYWRSLRATPGEFVTFVHLYDPELGVAALFDTPPRQGQYPTSCWRPGQVIADTITLAVDSAAKPGRYDLLVGLYDPANANQRLPMTGANVQNSEVGLAQIEVK